MDVKVAVRLAIEYVTELFELSDKSNVRLEEVEYLEYEQEWAITVGFDVPQNANQGLASIIGSKRDYKVVKINKKGEVQSVKIRKSNE